jgi:hypothetical protein
MAVFLFGNCAFQKADKTHLQETNMTVPDSETVILVTRNGMGDAEPALQQTLITRIVQKPQATENRAKKVANRPLLNPRVVFENGELWEFN